ncbi:MAG: phosphodiesterase [Firmicutes bacterium]|nr:phosphodiesterase [Bacillota bacterium]
MKLMFASDIHGSAYYCEKVLEAYKKENAERLILLGDLLYHGPRNDLPRDYDTRKVTAMLNSVKNVICAVRGNCEAEVDQMVLEFPCMADYMLLPLDGGKCAFVTHGHLYNNDTPPLLNDGDILIHGHTHEKVIEKAHNYIYINPGSASLPKDDDIHSYMVYDNGEFIIKDFDGNNIKSYKI